MSNDARDLINCHQTDATMTKFYFKKNESDDSNFVDNNVFVFFFLSNETDRDSDVAYDSSWLEFYYVLRNMST